MSGDSVMSEEAKRESLIIASKHMLENINKEDKENVTTIKVKDADPNHEGRNKENEDKYKGYEEYCHNFILQSRCPKLFNDEKRKGNCIELKEFIDQKSLQQIFKFMYYDDPRLEKENAFEILKFANDYGMKKLEKRCLHFIKVNISVKTVCNVLQKSIFYKVTELQNLCKAYIETHSKAVVEDRSFVEIGEDTLIDILKMDTLNVDETLLYNRCLDWAQREVSDQQKKQTNQDKQNNAKTGDNVSRKSDKEKVTVAKCLSKVLSEKLIRFPLMPLKDFYRVATSEHKLLTDAEIVDIYNYIACPDTNKRQSEFKTDPRGSHKANQGWKDGQTGQRF